MGCDIHTFVEIKTKGVWLLFNQPRVDRNYELFEKIAGVRAHPDSSVKPISRPKGLPQDISMGTKLCYDFEQPDAHTMTYLTLIEIGLLEKWWELQDYKAAAKFFNSQFGYLFGNGYTDIPELADPPPIEDVRFVIWFDN